MKRWYLVLGLAWAVAAMPAGCVREDEDDEMAEMGGEADEAMEEAEAAAETPEVQSALLARALIDEATASKTALERVPDGTITKTELEEEDGKLIWSFDIQVEGQDGIEEVHVDAMTGTIVKTEHETGGDEAAEGNEGAAA